MPTLKDIFNIVKFSHIEVIGSKADTDLRYFSDIDLQEFVKTDKTHTDILKFFQDIFVEVNETPNVYITDMKAGFYSGKPLKWSYNEIMQGFKRFDNKLKITFQSALTQDSVIKLDLVAFLDGEYIEITTNYYFDFEDRNKTFRELSEEELKKKLLYDARILKSESNIYKSLKRLYSYYELVGNKKGKKELLKLFNSPVGHLNKLDNSLKTISLLINNDKKPVKSDIVKAIYKIRDNLKPYTDAPLLNNLDNLTFDKIDSRVNKTIKQLSDVVTKETDKYILNLK
jgi:hypothetical protein